jgi:TRAP transporter TAXI family solute receptor
MSRRIKFPFLLLLVATAVFPVAAQAATGDPCDFDNSAGASHRLLTGPSGLNYDMVGRAIVNAYNTQHPDQQQLVACSDDGSIESVQLLSAGKAAFAIVQSDVAHSAWFHHPLPSATPPPPPCLLASCSDGRYEIRLIVPLFTEAVHVLIRPHLYLSSISGLRRRHLWVGKPDSGGYLTAERVLAAAGLRISDIDLVPADTSSGKGMDTIQGALDALKRMDPMLDAVFFTGAVPTREIQAALAPPDGANPNSEIQFVPLSVDMVSQLSSDSSYVETMIRYNDYGPGIPGPQGVATVGVEALLVTSDDSDMDNVALSMVSFLAGNMDSVRAQLPQDQPTLARLPLVDLPTRTPLLKRYFFRPAREYFYKDPWVFLRRVILWTAGVVILGISLFCWKRKKIGPHIMKEPVALFAGVLIVVVLAGGALAMWFIERHVNGDFASAPRALLSIIAYAVPFIGKTAMTATGQTAVTVMRWVLAPLFLGAVWPYAKKLLVERFWRPIARWLRGGHLFARHNHTSR